MKHTLLKRCAILLALFLSAGVMAIPHDATAATHAKKQHKAAKTTPKKTAKKAAQGSPILNRPDPNVSEPSEMITAIKNRAQDQFWDGKRPYPEQLRERINGALPPTAPILTGAIAQNELQKNDGSATATLRTPALRRVSFSDLSGVTFDDQPLQLKDSEAFRRSLETVSFELGRPCKTQEYFGWPLQQTEQDRVDRIFEEVNEKFKLRGFKLMPQKSRSIGSDVAAFTADRPEKRILGIWSAGDVGLLLLLCDSERPVNDAHAVQQDKTSIKKKKTKKKKPRKTTTPVTETTAPLSPLEPSTPLVDSPTPPPAPATEERRPEVIPGAPPKVIPPEPTTSTPTQSTPAQSLPPVAPPAATAPVTPPTPAPQNESPNAAFVPNAPTPTPPAPAPPVITQPAAPAAPTSVDQVNEAISNATTSKANEIVKDMKDTVPAVPNTPITPAVPSTP